MNLNNTSILRVRLLYLPENIWGVKCYGGISRHNTDNINIGTLVPDM